MSELTVKLTDTIEVTVSNTLRTAFARGAFEARMPDFGDLKTVDRAIVSIFLSIAAATKSVKGIDWKPPAFMATSDELVVSFEQMLILVETDVLIAWNEAIKTSSKIEAIPEEQEAADENPTGAAAQQSES